MKQNCERCKEDFEEELPEVYCPKCRAILTQGAKKWLEGA